MNMPTATYRIHERGLSASNPLFVGATLLGFPVALLAGEEEFPHKAYDHEM